MAADSIQTIRESMLYRDPVEDAKRQAREVLLRAVQAAAEAGSLPSAEAGAFEVEQPADTAHGDLAANLALKSAKAFKLPPRKIAEAIAAHLPTDGLISKVEVAGPGFINLFLADGWFADVVRAASATGEDWGRTKYGKGKRVNVEFVSANPTGPMHLGNARNGALGDGLAAALDWAGYSVEREFYINDAGNQVAKFGASLAARYLQIVRGEDAVEFPEDGYQGDDIKDRAREFYDVHGDAYDTRPLEELERDIVADALPKNKQKLKDDLLKYRVEYDTWFSEQSLYDSGEVKRTVELLAERGATYEKDGAIWYKATDYGEEKDEVLIRANGFPTYFASDIAYHANKFERGFELAIDVWGADHHGHVARMKGAMEAIGHKDQLDIVLYQFVRLMQSGEQVRMSKRTGKSISLTDLLDEVPIDSARFFFNQREPGSVVEFDLDLAVAQDSDNPVYYVQYAHARICSLLRTMEAEGAPLQLEEAYKHLSLLQSEAERALIRRVAAFPGIIVSAARDYDPARITRALIDTAGDFHRFYSNCRIKGEAPELQQARQALALAAKNVLANGLTLLKITVPEKM